MEQFIATTEGGGKRITFADIPDDYIRNIYYEYNFGYQKDIARTAIILYLTEYKTASHPTREELLAFTQAATYYHRSWGVFLKKDQYDKLHSLPEELRVRIENAIAPHLELQNDVFLRVTCVLDKDCMPVFTYKSGIRLPEIITERYDTFRPSKPLPLHVDLAQDEVVEVKTNIGYWYFIGIAVFGLLLIGVMK